MEKLTVQDVKRKLPMVKVKWLGLIFRAKVSGRKNKFAGVTPMYDSKGKKLKVLATFEFSWEAVTRAVNNNTHLII